jgi:MFS transporter, FHS family, glucose/mannose:H+ symporter
MGENRPNKSGSSTDVSWPSGREFVFLLHAGFLLIGVVTTLLGPILPMLAIKWSLDDAELGLFFMAQFTGAIIGSALSNRVIVRIGLLRLMVCGYVAMAVAVACLGIDSWLIGLVAVFVAGLSLGLTAPASNLLIAQINPERPASAVNILNFAWAVGAVAGPPMIAVLARDGQLIQALIALSVLLATVACLTARRAVMNPDIEQYFRSRNENDRTLLTAAVLRGWSSPYALFTGGLIFIYVGTEMATSGWIATYTLRLGSTTGFETMTPSVFWAGLLIGRAAAPAILNRVSDPALVLFGLLLAGLGLLLLLVSSSFSGIVLGVGLAGLGLAAVFPTTFAIFARHFGARASQMTGSFFVIGGLGGALIPWFVGIVSERFEDLRFGILVPVLGIASMILLQICIIRVLAQRHS